MQPHTSHISVPSPSTSAPNIRLDFRTHYVDCYRVENVCGREGAQALANCILELKELEELDIVGKS